MATRILCFHGMGVDSNVFKAQTESFRSLLPSNYGFTFLDAPVFCDPSPGAAEFYDGPYRCWYDTPSREKVAKCHEHVLDYLEREGGFDIVMGFSQGAALAASLLLHHQMERPDAPPLFKAAIFICSPLPFSCNTSFGIDVRNYFGIQSDKMLSRPNVVPDHLIADKYFLRSDKDLASASQPISESSSLHGDSTDRSSLPAMGVADGFSANEKENAIICKDADGPFYNIFHPDVDDVRIKIPTGHIYGKKDSWRRHSLDLVNLCSKSSGPVAFEHDGGHEVPREASEEICDLFEEVVARALWR